MKRILIAHHNPYLGEGLRAFLTELDSNLKTSVVHRKSDLHTLASRKSWCLLLTSMEIASPQAREFFIDLRRDKQKLKILFVGDSSRIHMSLEELMQWGHGFVSVKNPPEVVLEAAQRVVSGEPFVSPCAVSAIAEQCKQTRGLEHLTPAEKELLRLLGANHDDEDIAAMQGISKDTLKRRRRSLGRKVGIERPRDVRYFAFKYFYGVTNRTDL